MPLLSRPLIYPYKISFNNAPIPYTIPHTHTANNKFTSIIFYLSNQPLYLFQILIGDTVQSSYRMLHYQLAIRCKDHNLILCSRAEYAFNYDRLSSSYSFNGKPETGDVPGYQLRSICTILYPIWREKLNKCTFRPQ